MHVETIDFPTLPEDSLVLLLFYYMLRMDFLSIFLEDFRGPRKVVFLLKSCNRKVQVIMVCCAPNLKLLVFIPNMEKLLLWVLK